MTEEDITKLSKHALELFSKLGCTRNNPLRQAIFSIAYIIGYTSAELGAHGNELETLESLAELFMIESEDAGAWETEIEQTEDPKTLN